MQGIGRKLVTLEIDEAKVNLARETFRLAGVESWIELVTGDARQRIVDYSRYCFFASWMLRRKCIQSATRRFPLYGERWITG